MTFLMQILYPGGHPRERGGVGSLQGFARDEVASPASLTTWKGARSLGKEAADARKRNRAGRVGVRTILSRGAERIRGGRWEPRSPACSRPGRRGLHFNIQGGRKRKDWPKMDLWCGVLSSARGLLSGGSQKGIFSPSPLKNCSIGSSQLYCPSETTASLLPPRYSRVLGLQLPSSTISLARWVAPSFTEKQLSVRPSVPPLS